MVVINSKADREICVILYFSFRPGGDSYQPNSLFHKGCIWLKGKM